MQPLHALEKCLDSLHGNESNDPRFIDAGWFNWIKQKKQTTHLKVASRTQKMHMIHELDEVYDRDLLVAFTHGRIMLENKQKMKEINSACETAGLTLDRKNGHILVAESPHGQQFVVFWYSLGYSYIYYDQRGYKTFRSVADIIHHIRTNKDALTPKDAFLQRRIEAVKELSRMMLMQLKSRLEILENFVARVGTMKQSGFRMNTGTQNEFSPCEGTRQDTTDTNVFYIFHDKQFNYFEFDSRNKFKTRLISDNIHGLLEKMLQYAKKRII